MTFVQQEDRVGEINGNVRAFSNGRIALYRNTGSLVLELNVIGTHFPALSTPTDAQSPELRIDSVTNTGNIRVNYNDGTGWHSYSLTDFGGNYRLSFIRRSNNQIGTTPTPGNISSGSAYAVPVHFYEDLPIPSGTVDDFYNQERIILIEIENFQDVNLFSTYFVGLHGNLPGSLNRMRNVNELSLRYAYTLDGVSSSLTRVYSKILRFTILGFSLGAEIPQWLLNSSEIEELDMWQMFNFNGENSTTSRLNELFDGVNLPNLKSINLRNTGVDFELPNIYQNIDALILNENNSSGLKLSPDLTNYNGISLSLLSTAMAVIEYKRLFSSVNAPAIVNIQRAVIDTDIVLDSVNSNTITLSIGGATNFNNELPSFLSQLTVLNSLSFTSSLSNQAIYSNVTSWGVAGISDSISELTVENQIGLPSSLPPWFSNLINLSIFNCGFCETQLRIDDFIENFSSIVELNASMTVGATQFREIDFRPCGINLSRNISPRPSGIYQAPDGYIQGSDNGTPSSPMEWIYVLVNQYAHTVTVLNATSNGFEVFTP